jgi:hypothetical protein
MRIFQQAFGGNGMFTEFAFGGGGDGGPEVLFLISKLPNLFICGIIKDVVC